MTVEVNILKSNATIVDALGSSLRSGGNALGTVPDLLKRVLKEEMWREFVTQRGEHVLHERFVDFIVARPLRGIGASVDLVRRIVEDDPEVLDLLDQALRGKHGGDRKTSKKDNITLDRPSSPTGTSREYALRKLRVSAPELHAEVIAGNITAHAAMVEAGFRKRQVTVVVDEPSSVAKTLKKSMSPEALAELIDLLKAE